MEIGIRIGMGKQTWTLITELESMKLEYRIGIRNWNMVLEYGIGIWNWNMEYGIEIWNQNMLNIKLSYQFYQVTECI